MPTPRPVPGSRCLLAAFIHSLALLLLAGALGVDTVSGGDKSLRNDLFQVYWNVPTFLCKKHNVDFLSLHEFNIIQNSGDEFRGDKVVILYDPGLFPSLTEDGKVNKNNGVPQLGNLTKHLTEMRREIKEAIPDRNFQGVAVLDQESWRPVWKQNWGSLLLYKEYSRKVEQELHPEWPKEKIDARAEHRFEVAARKFMEETLTLARQMRPGGKWGYYAFPYCFNYTPKNMNPDCPAQTKEDNNHIQWLFDESESLYPSLYLSLLKLNEDERKKFMEGRIKEAERVAKRSPKMVPPPLLPYIWYRYYDKQQFLSDVDLENSLKLAYNRCGGAVIWGSYIDVNSKQKCQALHTYVTNKLGPLVKKLTTRTLSDYQNKSTDMTNSLEMYETVLLNSSR